MKIVRRLFLNAVFCFLSVVAFSQFADTRYSLAKDNDKLVINGFVSFESMSDDEVFANSLLWTVENVCPKLFEGITDCSISERRFAIDLALQQKHGGESENIYACKAEFRAVGNRIVFHLSDIVVETKNGIIKRSTPIEKLNPEKKPAHKQILEELTKTASDFINQVVNAIFANKCSTIEHWDEIAARKVVEGMTEDECRLTLGKPQAVMETNGEKQWMYSSWLNVFFKDGKVDSIIR